MENNEPLFLGKPFGYWIEVSKRIDSLNVSDFIKEIADLRGKVSFYEERVRQMNELMNK